MAYVADPTNPSLPANSDQVFGAAQELRLLKQQLETNLQLANSYAASLFGLTQSEIDAALVDINSVYTKTQIDDMLQVIDANTLGGETKESLVAEVDNEVTRLVLPKGAAYRGSTAGNQLGALKITLPQTWSDTQVSFVLTVFTGIDGESYKIFLSGRTDVATQAWTDTTAYMIGVVDKPVTHNVRFANDTAKCCIYIGELDDSWTKLSCSVDHVQVSELNNELNKWDAGWAIGMELNNFIQVDVTKVVTLVHTEVEATPNTIPIRDGAADINARLFRSNFTTQLTTPAASVQFVMRNSTTDNYLRPVSRDAVMNYIGHALLHSDALRISGANIQLVKRNGSSEVIDIGQITKNLGAGVVGQTCTLIHRTANVTFNTNYPASALALSVAVVIIEGVVISETYTNAPAGTWKALGAVAKHVEQTFLRIA